ncbi:YlaF family protein [Anoxybacteroides amylolyticum]|uniref:Putative membrane protein n=1 Tax=Anoxybacteroides amylolyticum TaxID=294699 RepID=A0A160F3S6_9BACL|nr:MULTISPECIES: YlaF family protein [Anoxybacillus]ANB60966.1 putative membrane protein [Anoxybacillus amylolyticus]MCL6585834.1 YlaF family protein [Anoxybacillus sp.]
MKSIQPVFLLFAILAASSIMAIGIFIAEQITIGVIISIVAFVLIMGIGFITKKRMREKGML